MQVQYIAPTKAYKADLPSKNSEGYNCAAYLGLLVLVAGVAIFAGAQTLLQHKTWIPINGVQTEVYNHLDNFPFKMAIMPITIGAIGFVVLTSLVVRRRDKPSTLTERIAIAFGLAIATFCIFYGSSLLHIDANATHLGGWPNKFGMWDIHKFIQPENISPIVELSKAIMSIGAIVAVGTFLLGKCMKYKVKEIVTL